MRITAQPPCLQQHRHGHAYESGAGGDDVQETVQGRWLARNIGECNRGDRERDRAHYEQQQRRRAASAAVERAIPAHVECHQSAGERKVTGLDGAPAGAEHVETQRDAHPVVVAAQPLRGAACNREGGDAEQGGKCKCALERISAEFRSAHRSWLAPSRRCATCQRTPDGSTTYAMRNPHGCIAGARGAGTPNWAARSSVSMCDHHASRSSTINCIMQWLAQPSSKYCCRMKPPEPALKIATSPSRTFSNPSAS